MARGIGRSVSIDVSGDVDRVDDTTTKNTRRRSIKDMCRTLGCCIRLSPWVSLISSIFIALGLAVWSVYVKRALANTTELSSALINEPIILVQRLEVWVGWAWLVGICAVSCIAGITFLLGIARSYQKAAQLPTTNCAAPGKVSYGAYAAFIAAANSAVWILSLGIALAIAGHLVWIVGAFISQSAVTEGMSYVSGTDLVPTQQQRVAKEALISGLTDSALDAADVSACPNTCFNLGSLYTVLQVSKSCYCQSFDAPYLATLATSLWKNLVHCLAALALAGIGATWLLMNLSANFAHARRDIHDTPGWDKALVTGDVFAAVRTSKKEGRKGGDIMLAPITQDLGGHGVDRSPAHTPEFTPLSALPAAVLTTTTTTGATTTTSAAAAVGEGSLNPAGQVESGADPYAYAYPSAGAGGEEISASGAGAIAGATGRTSSSGADATQEGAPSPGTVASRAATFNTTAQRYAAYRLRAAQSKQSPNERKWVR